MTYAFMISLLICIEASIVLLLIILPSAMLQRNWERFSGTLLPRPALYFFGPPMNSLGLGNSLSGWNRHLESSIGVLAFLLGERSSRVELVPGLGLRPLDKVYELESIVALADC